MTDFFHALLDRAEGTATGLEPRKASRFENDPGVHQDVSDFPLPSVELSLPAPATYRAPAEFPQPRTHFAALPPVSPGRSDTVVASPAPTIEKTFPANEEMTPAEEPAPSTLSTEQPRLSRSDFPSNQVLHALTSPPAGPFSAPVPVNQVHVFEPRVSPGAPIAPSPAPSPLAAPPVNPLSPSQVNPFQPTLVVAETDPAPAAPAQPPVIEISIGTIEFRAAPPSPISPTAAPRTAARDTHRLPSLEDYLKSRRSVRS